MEIKTTIVSISREELVNLFATGLYGSSYLDADYESNDDLADCECFEDKLAVSLLAGRSITFRDMYAEGYAYGELPRVIDDNDEDVVYTVTLEDIKRGLERQQKLVLGHLGHLLMKIHRIGITMPEMPCCRPLCLVN